MCGRALASREQCIRRAPLKGEPALLGRALLFQTLVRAHPYPPPRYARPVCRPLWGRGPLGGPAVKARARASCARGVLKAHKRANQMSQMRPNPRKRRLLLVQMQQHRRLARRKRLPVLLQMQRNLRKRRLIPSQMRHHRFGMVIDGRVTLRPAANRLAAVLSFEVFTFTTLSSSLALAWRRRQYLTLRGPSSC